ncbi:MAG: Si-specific NAD(P)(+) transhydrogenase [Gaiellales bacterium]
MSNQYDLVVIGSGPAGQRAAVQAAKLGKRVAIVEKGRRLGGVCVNSGTIPSKTLREAVVYLTGHNQRSVYGQSYRLKSELTMADLLWRAQNVVNAEVDVIEDQLRRNHVELVCGVATFSGPREVSVVELDGVERRLETGATVIAVGTSPSHPHDVNFDGQTILDSDQILDLKQIPSTMVVVGAGVIGIEYASMFAALRTKVTVVEKRARLLEFCDAEIVEALQYHLRELGVQFRFGESVESVETGDGATVTHLASGKRIVADTVLYSAGRIGSTFELGLDAIGVEHDDRGRIKVDEHFQTACEGVYAVGDVIGFPSLAATSAEQGRLAACHALGHPGHSMNGLLPVGIYTIPEISYVGRNEEELTAAAIPYEVGIARYRELARGQIVGDHHGMLKLLASPEDGRILGVHVFGTSATELVHIGQAVMGNGGGLDFLVDSVFNYPTFAESYKVAALDATNKLRTLARVAG